MADHVLSDKMSGILCTNSQRRELPMQDVLLYSAYTTFRKPDVSLSSKCGCHYNNIFYDFLNITVYRWHKTWDTVRTGLALQSLNCGSRAGNDQSPDVGSSNQPKTLRTLNTPNTMDNSCQSNSNGNNNSNNNNINNTTDQQLPQTIKQSLHGT